MGLGTLIFPRKGSMRGQYCFFMAKYSNLYGRFLLYTLIVIFTDSASYFHKIMFTGISLVDILNHSRMGIGMVIFSSKVTWGGRGVCENVPFW